MKSISLLSPGTIIARHIPVRAPSSYLARGLLGRGTATTVLGRFLSAVRSRRFFPESEAQRLTLSPRLPHHRRHPLTADEALAGIVIALVALAGSIYLIARWLA